jgi:hypothetical protein
MGILDCYSSSRLYCKYCMKFLRCKGLPRQCTFTSHSSVPHGCLDPLTGPILFSHVPFACAPRLLGPTHRSYTLQSRPIRLCPRLLGPTHRSYTLQSRPIRLCPTAAWTHSQVLYSCKSALPCDATHVFLLRVRHSDDRTVLHQCAASAHGHLSHPNANRLFEATEH